MITLATPTQQIISELDREEMKVLYWFKKQHHGEKGYDRMQDDMIERAKRERKDQNSEVIDYISPQGNRWMVFVACKYYKDVHEAVTQPVAFCYYETYGSVGAYMKGHSQYGDNREPMAIYFTDHFFLRFCQRLGIEMRSRWMVQRFLSIIPGIMFQTSGERDKLGRLKVDCRFPASIGRGIIRKDGPLIEIRTFLTDPELNGKQRRETKQLREAGDTHCFAPQTVKMKRILQSDNFAEAFQHEIDQVVAMGVDRRAVEMTATFGIFIMNAIIDLGYADAKDIPFWTRHGEVNKHLLCDIGAHYSGVEKISQQELGDKFEQVLKNDNIRGYDLRMFYANIDNQIKELEQKANKR